MAIINSNAIVKALSISTAHLPQNSPNFGEIRFVETEFGFLVWPLINEIVDVPEWLRPILDFAVANEIAIIEFDCDSEAVDLFTQYDW